MLRILILGFLCIGSLGYVAKPPMPDDRIIGGVPTMITDHPHQVSLQVFDIHYCGASIISSKWIVTAAHCADRSASVYEVRAGTAVRILGDIYLVKRVIRHPQYNGSTIDYDIAVMELNSTLVLSSSVKPIKLATVELPANTTVNVTGWGAEWVGGPNAILLQQVSVPIVDRKSCASAYEYFHDITPRMICAGEDKGGKDSCRGDSGGPLTANNTLYGIVSWGNGCAKPKYPGVYSNVANLRAWIRNMTGI